jgi:hypothetical protein
MQNPGLAALKLIDDDMRKFADNLNVQYFSILDDICDATGCLTRVNSDPTSFIVWDATHLTTPGARYTAQRLSATISPWLSVSR